MRRLICFSFSILAVFLLLPSGARASVDSDGDGYPDDVELMNAYDPNDPRPVKLEKHIEISVADQKLSYFVGQYEIGTHPISGGKPGWPTPKGTFKIMKKNPKAWSRAGGLWMPYWMAFAQGGAVGIHELPIWPSGRREGSDHLGKPASHGCVRLGIGPAKALYDWAPVGTRVVVR